MSPALLFAILIAYFVLLLGVAWATSRNATNDSFFIGNKSSNWMLVAFGMVGTTLSGATFISVPGAVGHDGFGYAQILIGYVFGYIAVAFILLPLYYRLKLTSIYHYLDVRLGRRAYQSGAGFFILSRLLGATARLYLVVNILQVIILDSLGIPFWLTTLVILGMILVYTYQGGVKTIVWTDTLQTTCMLIGLVACVVFLLNRLDLSVAESLAQMDARGLSTVFTTAVDSPSFYLKQIVAGAFIVLTMTGMDQEMMQKTISVKTLADSQKNLLSLTVILVIVLSLFLFLGGLLHLYAPIAGVTATGDKLFPAIVTGHLPASVQIIFLIALVSALFPSADGAITALTSTFCIDILGIQRRADLSEAQQVKLRQRVHLGFAALFLALVLVFKMIDNASMIGVILKIAAYTYGPLLGLFAFGILTSRTLTDPLVPVVTIGAPLICALLELNQAHLLGSYRLGLELLMVNGILVFAGLWAISQPQKLDVVAATA
ncbi:sodium:solute symporter [Massilia sp. TWR1-2-2]|uniref:sodium:solute symporter n=1 Tax=Massilia sp. TWR1-2-2 TaxID=2804584 RepID=UPI003CEBD8EB